MKSAVMEIVQQSFRPEFINRIDDIVVFHPLGTRADPRDRRHPAQLPAQAPARAQHGARRSTTRRATCSARPGFDPVYGARPLKRAIQQQIENPLAQRILRNEFAPGRPRPRRRARRRAGVREKAADARGRLVARRA